MALYVREILIRNTVLQDYVRRLLDLGIVTLILVILSIPILINYQGYQIPYASDLVNVMGSITASGCGTIGGTTETYVYERTPNQTIKVCKHGEDYYELVSIPAGYGCFASESFGRDPTNNRTYTFANHCHVPRGCEPSTSWGAVSGGYFVHKLIVKAEGKDFELSLGAGSVFCSATRFLQEEKKIIIDAIGRNGTSSLEVMIPEELLSGDLQVLVDGNKTTKFSFGSQGNMQVIRLDVDFENDYQSKNITIIGTNVIPEFPGSVLLLLLGMVPFLLFQCASKLKAGAIRYHL